jgi:hypothetical protein
LDTAWISKILFFYVLQKSLSAIQVVSVFGTSVFIHWQCIQHALTFFYLIPAGSKLSFLGCLGGQEYLNQTGNVRINVTLRRFRITTFAVEKKCVTYSEKVFVALVTQHAMRMRRIILSSVTVLQPFTLFHQGHDFLKKERTEHKV